MNLLFWGMTASVLGKTMLALGVILVHKKMASEHRIDAAVIKSFQSEFVITILGLMLILLGYFLEIAFFGGFSHFLTCEGGECAAAIGSVLSQ